MMIWFLLIALLHKGCCLHTCSKQDISLKWPEKDFEKCEITTITWRKNDKVIMETITINGSIGVMNADEQYKNRFYLLNMHEVLLQDVSPEDEGNFSYKANCDNKESFESTIITLNVFPAVKKVLIEKIINIYEGKSLEVSLPHSPYCYVRNILWYKDHEIFAINFLESEHPIYTLNPYMNDIVFITPYTLRFNHINMLHRGIYNVSVDYWDGTKLFHMIKILVKRVGEIMYKDPLKDLNGMQCVGKTVIFPWKLSEPLKESVSHSISVNLSLKLFNHRDVLNITAKPTTILEEKFNSLDFENMISSDSFDLADIFLPFFNLDFLSDMHIGLYTLEMSLLFKKEVLHNEKTFKVLTSEEDGPQETTRTTEIPVINGDDDVDEYETLAVKPAFYILSASHIEHLNDSLVIEYKGPFPLEIPKLCHYLSSGALCSVLRTKAPFNNLTMNLNFNINPFSCQYFVDSLFYMQVLFNGTLITETSFKLGKMRRPLTIPSLDWSSSITKVVINPITTVGLSDDEDFSDEVFMKRYTNEISNVLYEATIHFKEGTSAQVFHGVFKIVIKLKKAKENHQTFCSELEYHVNATDSMLSQKHIIRPFLEDNFVLCFIANDPNECVEKKTAKMNELAKVSITLPSINLPSGTVFSWSVSNTNIIRRSIKAPCYETVCERELNMSEVDDTIKQTVGNQVSNQTWTLTIELEVRLHYLEEIFILSRDFIYST